MPLKVLQLCHKPPFPSIDGGCLEMGKMSTFFDKSAEYDLRILSFHTQKHPFIIGAFMASLNNSRYNSVFVNTKPKIFGALSGLMKGKSYNLSRFYSEKFKNELHQILKAENFDIIQLESIYVAKYINDIRSVSNAKIVLNSPNVEFEIWERLGKEVKNTFKKKYISILAKQLKKEEIKVYKSVDAIIAISRKDEKVYKDISPKIKLVTIPFAIDVANYKETLFNKHEISFFHLGSMNWSPNINGLKWFVEEVWNEYFSTETNTKLNIAGLAMPDSFFNYNTNNLNVTGFVNDAKKFIADNDVMIVPLFSGSGLRIKIIEAMAMGKCVIASSIGAEGIDYIDGENIIIANSKLGFKRKIREVIDNPKTIKKIGEAARYLVENKYNSAKLAGELNEFYKTVLC
jgi:glycosyltransferase involved in cell wall biosynthesis